MCNLYGSTDRKTLRTLTFVQVPDDLPDAPAVVGPLAQGWFIGQQGLVCSGQWGMIPPGSPTRRPVSPSTGRPLSTNNARSETVTEKPSYRTAWRQRQFGLVLVDDFYEPSYESGKAVRWKIQLASGDPFAIACLWDRWRDPQTGEVLVSFSMLTVNADQHPVMRQFHKPGDEKRTPVVMAPHLHDQWLSANTAQALELMALNHMPELKAFSAPSTVATRQQMA